MRVTTQTNVETMQDLYGDEKELIVVNESDRVISIGFGENGNEGGYTIPRTDLPIVLTDEHAITMWKDSSDFRRMLAKGFLRMIGREEADRLTHGAQQRAAHLEALARKSARVQPVDPEDFTQQKEFQDEATISHLPQNEAAIAAYDAEFSKPATPPSGIEVLGEKISSRILFLVEHTKSGKMGVAEALQTIDQDSKLLTRDDYTYLIDKCPYEAVQEFASVLRDGMARTTTTAKKRPGRPRAVKPQA